MSVYPPPFRSEHFFFVPLQWTRRIQGMADLDAMHLLLSMHVEGAMIVFPPEQPEAYWTRYNDEKLPNLVSHVTYRNYLDGLRSSGWLRNCRPEDVDSSLPSDLSECYQLTAWPNFDGLGIFYLPRKYIHNRWSLLLKTNEWGVKGALMGLLLLLCEQQALPPNAVPFVSASQVQVAKSADRILGDSTASEKVGEGLRQLVALGIIAEDVTRSGRNNHWYVLSTDCFELAPSWPLEEVIQRCGLDPESEQDWAILVQTFLQVNYKPLDESLAVWQLIRSTFPYLDVELNPMDLVAELHARAGRQSTEVKRTLKDARERYQRQLRQHWLQSAWTEVKLQHPTSVAAVSPLDTPTAARNNVQLTLLEIRFERNRISVDDTIQLLSQLRLEVRQGNNIVEVADGIGVDAHAVKSHKVLRANQLHGKVEYHKPFSVHVVCNGVAPDPRLTLKIRLRARYT